MSQGFMMSSEAISSYSNLLNIGQDDEEFRTCPVFIMAKHGRYRRCRNPRASAGEDIQQHLQQLHDELQKPEPKSTTRLHQILTRLYAATACTRHAHQTGHPARRALIYTWVALLTERNHDSDRPCADSSPHTIGTPMNQATSSLGNDTHSSAVAIGAANVPHLADHTKDMCNLPAPRSSALPDVGTAVMVAQTEPATTNTCLTSDTSIFRPTTELDPRWASEVPDDIVSGAMAPANSDICIVCAAPSASADHHTTAIPCFSCGRNSHEDCIREYRELGLYGCPLFKCCGNGPTAWGMCLESFNTADMSNVPLPSVVSASMTILPWASVTSHAPSPNIGGIDFEAAASFASPSQVGNGERTLLSPLGPNTVKETLLPNRTAETATEYDSADDISTSIHEWDSIADFGTQIDPDGSLHRDNSFLNAPQFEEDFDQSMYESSIDFSSGSSTSHDISETDAAPSDASMTPQSLFGPQSPMDWGCSA